MKRKGERYTVGEIKKKMKKRKDTMTVCIFYAIREKRRVVKYNTVVPIKAAKSGLEVL